MDGLEQKQAQPSVSHPPGVVRAKEVKDEEQLQESFSSRVKDVFQRFSKGGESELTVEELHKALRALGPSFTDQDVQGFAAEVNKSPDGKISLRAFTEWLKGGSKGAQKVARKIWAAAEKRNMRIKDIFQTYDQSGDGSLDVSELRGVMKALGSFTNEEVLRATRDLDKSQDGNVTLPEFADWIRAPSGSKEIAKAKAILAPADDDGLEAVYYNFCGPGKAEMDGKSFAKLCKDSQLLEPKLPHTEVDIIFAKVKQGKERQIEFHQFESALEKLAQKKGVPVDQIRTAVLTTSRPITKGTQAQANRFHDDKSSYTGTHATAAGGGGDGSSPLSPPRKVVSLRKIGSPDGAVAAIMRSALKQSDAQKDTDNRDLWKVFGPHTKAGRTLKRIYSESAMIKPLAATTGSQGGGGGGGGGGQPWRSKGLGTSRSAASLRAVPSGSEGSSQMRPGPAPAFAAT